MNRKTPYVIVERQLWPQPPLNTYPYWCYINTLMFKDKDTHKTVWEQEIPEAEIDIRCDKIFQCSLRYESDYGWILVAKASHERAKGMIMKLVELNLMIEQ